MGKVGRGVSFVFLAQLFRMGAKGGLILLLTRYLLEPSEYGQLFLALAVLGFGTMFASLGLGKAGGKYITEYRETEPDLVPVVIRATFVYRVTAIAVVSGVLALFHEQIAALVGDASIGVLLLVGIGYVSAKSIRGVGTMFFQGFNRMDLHAIVSIVSNLVLIVAVPGLVVLDFGLAGAMAGYALSSGVAAVIGMYIIYTRFYTAVSVTRSVRKTVSRRVLRYSVPLTFTMGASVLNGRTDTILIGVFRGPTAIAFYTLSKQIVDFLIAPAHSLGFGISPTFGEQKANEHLDQGARLYERSFTYIAALYIPAAAGVVLVAEPTITLLFGADYTGAVPALQIFSLYVVVRAIDSITSDALDYLGRARSRAVAKGSLALANVVLNVALIPTFGIVGAAAATVLTDGIYVATELYIIRAELPIDAAKLGRSALVIAAITAGMGAAVYPLVGFATSLPALAAVVGVGGVVWLTLTALTDVVDLRALTSTLT